MSKVGKKPIELPPEIKIDLRDNFLIVEGPKGKLERKIPDEIKIKIEETGGRKVILVSYEGSKEKKALWGTFRSLIYNMIEGVKNGFEKKLIIEGVGWRANMEGKDLVLNIGFSHPVKVSPPDGINFSVEKNNMVIVSGIDKEVVGNTAAKIRKIRPPEPYKGKGIRYENEVIRRKAGKKAATSA